MNERVANIKSRVRALIDPAGIPPTSFEPLNLDEKIPKDAVAMYQASNHPSSETESANDVVPAQTTHLERSQTNTKTTNPHSRLNTFFTLNDRTESYSDGDIQEIAMLLRHVHPQWSKVPRCYIVLRNIDALDCIDACISVGLSDYWLPASERNLPDCMKPSSKAAFIKKQELILTKALDLEKGSKGQHCYFRRGEAVPFEVKSVLGRGAYGQVDRVLSLVSYKEYARKRVLRYVAFRGRKKEDIKQFTNEIEILKSLHHIHIVEFVGSYTDSKYVGLIMVPIAEGDLGAYLRKITSTNYPELRTFFGCLATALEFLHERKVRHKDIKLSNILVDAGKVLFADFGLSLDFTDASGSTTMSMVNGMTPRYCSPEVAAQTSRNTMSDIWSLGVVFLEMVAALEGVSLDAMDAFMEQCGTRQKFFRANMEGLKILVTHLEGLGQASDNVILSWVEEMLHEE